MGIQKPRGTQDLLPNVIGNWRYVEDRIRRICKAYGFDEVRTPILKKQASFYVVLVKRLT